MKNILTILALIFFSALSQSQTTYIWNGSVSSNFSAAGNWTPVRQVGLATDILIFNSGTSVNVINVNQVTVGQLVVMNNTQLKLSPTTGNPKVLSIQGNAGDLLNGEEGQEHDELANIKYQEYNVVEPTDLAERKYLDYMVDSLEIDENIATIKYNEYKNPAANGMGDIKQTEGEFDSMTDDDLLIDTGSSLTIEGNDPKLSIYLKQNATAAISGSVVFKGEAQHTFNSFDTQAITFKEGGELNQSCPGSLFTTSGVNNSASFEDGSTFTINHSGALDPYGVSAPSSKVLFSEHSTLKFNVSCMTPLNITGRVIPIFVVKPNVIMSLNISNSINDAVTFSDIIVNTGGKLTINCNADNITNLNIKGDITVDGALHFPYNKLNRFNINFNGSDPQNISGNGPIDISKSANQIHISNSITLHRDLTVHSHVVHTKGAINTNGYIFKIYNHYTSRAMIPVGIVILSEDAGDNLGDNSGDNPGNDPGNNPGENISQTQNVNSSVPASFSLSQNYPNPFNPKTKINYTVPKPSSVKITVYDLSGQEVATLVNGSRESSLHTAEFDGSGFASGVYFYKITASAASGEVFTKTLKMILTK